MLLRSENPVLSRRAQLDLAAQLVDYWGGGISVVSTIDPVNGNNAATLGDAADSRLFRFLMYVFTVGVIDETVTVKLQQSATSGGSYSDITGKTATVMAATADGTQKVIFVKTSELDADKPFVKPVITVANGTSSLVTVIGLGIGPLASLATDVDLSTVSEVLGGSSYIGAKAYFFTNDVTPDVDTVRGDLTPSALAAAGVSLNAWEGPVTLPNGAAGMHHNVAAIAAASPTEETLKGIYVVAADGTTLLHAEVFPDDGVGIAEEGDSIVYELVLPLAGQLATGLTN